MLFHGKNKKITKAFGLSALVIMLSFWAVCMYWLTYESAYEIRESATVKANYSAREVMEHVGACFERINTGNPGAVGYAVCQSLDMPIYASFGATLATASYDLNDAYAAAIYDSEGNELFRSGNFIYFNYCDDSGNIDNLAYAMLDKQFPNAEADENGYKFPDMFSFMSCQEVELTGVMDGGELLLQKIVGFVPKAPGSVSGDWITFFEDYSLVPRNAETVTLSTEFGYFHLSSYNYSDRKELWNTLESNAKYNIEGNENVVFNLEKLWDTRRVYQYEIICGGEKLYYAAAVGFNPLRAAVSRLLGVYLITFVMTVGWPAGMLLDLRSRIEKPLKELNRSYSAGYKRHPLYGNSLKFAEIERLAENYDDVQRKLDERDSQLIAAQKALDFAKTAEENRRILTSNIAHELKTPLAVIHSYAEGLQEHIAEDKRDHYLRVILDETERLDSMVLDMLDISRMEAGKTKLYKESFSLLELTESVFDRLRMACEGKNIQVEIKAAERVDTFADVRRMEQVVENLATNAVKNTRSGGSITVNIIKNSGGDKTRFSIENDGDNIPEDKLEKLWDVFYRTDNSRDRSGGTGLGLAIVKNIIQLHGGGCTVQNTPRGVRFSFTV